MSEQDDPLALAIDIVNSNQPETSVCRLLGPVSAKLPQLKALEAIRMTKRALDAVYGLYYNLVEEEDGQITITGPRSQATASRFPGRPILVQTPHERCINRIAARLLGELDCNEALVDRLLERVDMGVIRNTPGNRMGAIITGWRILYQSVA